MLAYSILTQVETGVAELTINGEPVRVTNGSAWVDVGLLKAGVNQLEDRDLTTWLSKTCSTAAPQVTAIIAG